MKEEHAFSESWIHIDIDKDSEESKHWASLFPQTMYWGDIKKGKRFTISYSYNTNEESLDKTTKMHSVITKTFPVKIIKIKRNKPRLDVYVERVE